MSESFYEVRFKLKIYKCYIRPFLYLLINKVISIAEQNNINESIEYLDTLISDLINPFITNKEAIKNFMNNYIGESELKDMINESIINNNVDLS